MKKIFSVFLSLVIVMLCFCGCSKSIGKTDLNRRKIIVAIGIDVEGDIYKLTVRSYDPTMKLADSADSGGESKTIIYHIEGETIAKAISNIMLQTGDEPAYVQNNIIIIGKEVAQRGIDKVIDFFVREKRTRYSTMIALSNDKASDIIECDFMGNSMPQKELEELINSGALSGEVEKMNILLVAKYMSEPTTDVVLPMLEAFSDGENKNVRIAGTGIFKECKLVGHFDIDETRGMLIFSDKFNSGSISLDVDGVKITANIKKTSSKIKTEIKDGRVIFEVKTDVKCEIDEIERNFNMAVDEGEVEKIKKEVAEKIYASIKGAFDKSTVEYQSDALRLGKRLQFQNKEFFRNHYEDFSSVLSNAKLDLRVNVELNKIDAKGMIN
ncbi:MAG: Ger(x)C family spore germination protein [Clostridiales bacterium]|nr:Ger(x)C family spore germination protein [Clostridiales bacterium]